MSAPAIGVQPRTTPTKPTPVDWSHPLAPVGGWAALPHTGVDVFGNAGTFTTNASRTGSTAFGRAMSTSSATTGGVQFPVPAALYSATRALTIVSVTHITGLSVGNSQLLMIRDNASDAGPFNVASMWSNGGSADFGIRNQAGSFTNIGNASSSIASGLTTALGTRVHVGVLDAANNLATLYRDGSRIGSGTWSGGTSGLSWPTTSPGIGLLGYGTNTSSQGVLGSCSLAIVYPRALSANEVASISADPFQIFRQ